MKTIIQSFPIVALILLNVNTFVTLFMKITTISPDENEFTNILTSIPQKPQALYYSGTLPIKRQLAVAVVGTRKPTSYGIEVARQLADDLARRGVVIISGMALGIDAVAHKAALDVGGTTIAVLGNGLPKLYPHTNRQLGERIIASGGAIVTEFEEGIEPLPFNFLARNRIVSGLSDAVIVVEAARRSGTLNTAGHALEQGREVFAVPGNITSPLSAGCNELLRHGASPVTCAEDVLAVIAPQAANAKNQALLPLVNTPAEAKIVELIKSGIRDGEELQKQSNLSASDFSSTLTMLEINGVVKALGANKWSL